MLSLSPLFLRHRDQKNRGSGARRAGPACRELRRRFNCRFFTPSSFFEVMRCQSSCSGRTQLNNGLLLQETTITTTPTVWRFAQQSTANERARRCCSVDRRYRSELGEGRSQRALDPRVRVCGRKAMPTQVRYKATIDEGVRRSSAHLRSLRFYSELRYSNLGLLKGP